MCSGQYPAEWGDYLSALEQSSECGLFLEAQQCYAQIISHGISGASHAGLKRIVEAVTLFQRRETDLWYSEMRSIEGGGDNNVYSVDYRLATIIEHLHFRGVVAEQIPSCHPWSYGGVESLHSGKTREKGALSEVCLH
jgi:hypothetical protein